jgi:hypothetical protein
MKKANQKKRTDPIDKKQEVQKTNDDRIDQDFPGYPHPPSKEKTIKEQKSNTDEQYSDGSPNAFGESENEDVLRGELDNDNEEKPY